ncbi:Thioesterase/thiol ester dehydrase-isomerase [Canariomyces notabilis]|uniref:Thioesterase/thiol ester dehydrase-isomerase n=1 Tax=Canariomyces notabilis TaxID=2074819 RepID=A0AAN6QIP5_9PEZI|nr:Thioesterase/thiol ester dehydrase-isomerase [Canariomyces arenarius]
MAHDDTLLSLQETLNLVKLPRRGEVRRFMSTRGAYLPGSDFPAGREMPMFHKASYGGHVYGQSALAAYRVWRELEDERGAKQQERLDLHAIHGFFTRAGIPDRPFIYDVTPLTSSRTFSTLSVTARQPSKPSTRVNPLGNERFPLADAALPLSPPAFTAICSLKLPEPDSAGVSTQESPPQTRFAAILSQRAPHAWPPAPPVDLTGVVALVGADQPGRFPIAEMRKVDMSAYNTGRDVHERRELVLYRLRLRRSSPDTTGSSSSSEEGWEWDANAHVAAHAYIADRNGLLMVANHIGFGFTLTRAASLSYSFVMHVGAEQAVMRHHDDGSDSDGWWIQEAWFPRSGAGRGIVESKIWSPAGVHVASEYQDGLVQGLADTGRTES